MAKNSSKKATPDYQTVLNLLEKGYSDEQLTSELRKLGYSGIVKKIYTINATGVKRTFLMKF